MFDSQQYTARYNALPDVVDADRTLETSGRGRILDRLCGVILDHGLEAMYGVRLLHTHHLVDAGEWMIETEERLDDGSAALTTRADAVARCGTRAAANCWMFADGRWIALEYSTDAGVTATDPIDAHPAFAAAFAQALAEAGVASILGLCAAQRHFFRAHGDGARGRGLGLLETTDATRRANVLQFADLADHPEGTLIQTVWLATDGDEAGCPVGGFHCTILVVCAEKDYGGHYKKVDHDREPLPSH